MSGAVPAGSSPVLNALETELTRSFAALKSTAPPVYFLSYDVTDAQVYSISSGFGALMDSSEKHQRFLQVDLRVGSPKFDNRHLLRGETSASSPGMARLPVEDDADAIRSAVWRETDRSYRMALPQFARAQANAAEKLAGDDHADDFAAGAPVTEMQPLPTLKFDPQVWEPKVRLYTAVFANHPEFYSARARLVVESDTRWYANSEGSRLQIAQTTARIEITASTKAADGMVLSRTETFFGFSPDQLPNDAAVIGRAEQIAKDLTALRTAPVIEPCTVPAVLSGRAAAVFFHEVLGHRLEGDRLKRDEDGQTLKKLLGHRLLPSDISVCCDPTLDHYGATALGGHYAYDDEGIAARRVSLVENGVLKGFLMSRTPIDGFTVSNGHGRRALGESAMARQSNLIVEAKEGVSRTALKKQLTQLIRKQHKPYGLYIDDIEGGFTGTGRIEPNAFNVRPVMVYRVFPDGREELVRGADFIGTPLTALGTIAATDDSPAIFNGICGAESGSVPVSAVAPGLLLSEVEIQKKESASEKLPYLPAPSASSRPD